MYCINIIVALQLWLVSCYSISAKVPAVHGPQPRRIMGGARAPPEQYPFAAAYYNNPGACSGAVLGRRTVLTAAHCFQNRDVGWMYVSVGSEVIFSPDADTYSVLAVKGHPNFNGILNAQCDIGLVFTTRPFVFGPTVGVVKLVNTSEWMNKLDDFEAVGFGKYDNDGVPFSRLMRTRMRLVPAEACRLARAGNLSLTPDMVCFESASGASAACDGDSGGPILWRGMVVGVLSHSRGERCAPSSLFVYASAWSLRRWLATAARAFETTSL